jgi:hypothetical protein
VRRRPAFGSSWRLRGRISDRLRSSYGKPFGLAQPESDERAFTVNVRQPLTERRPLTPKPVPAE